MENPEKKEVMVILGTKAETIKMSPVLRELTRHNIPYFLLHTGQHDISGELNELGLRVPDAILEESKGRGRFSSAVRALFWNAGKFRLIRRYVKKVSPKLVLVHGDTMTTATAALAVKSMPKTRRPILAHIEAGLRSHSIREPFPEELSRLITDWASDVLFCPTVLAAGNVRKSASRKKNKTVLVVGNTNIDSLKHVMARERISVREGRTSKSPPYIIAKLHRQENIKSRKRLEEFVRLLENAPARVEFILTDNTRKRLERTGLISRVECLKHVNVRKNMPYADFIKLFANAACIITDGGGETEEACFLKVPCIEFRYYSERQEAEKAGVAFRWSGCTSTILKLLESVVSKKPKTVLNAKNPYGNGNAGKRIVDEIEKILGAA